MTVAGNKSFKEFGSDVRLRGEKAVNRVREIVDSGRREVSNLSSKSLSEWLMLSFIVIRSWVEFCASLFFRQVVVVGGLFYSAVPMAVRQRISAFMTKNRDIFVCMILLPASMVFGLYMKVRRFYLYNVKNSRSKSSHEERVLDVQQQVQRVPFGSSMCTARPTWLTMSLREGLYKKTLSKIDVSQLDNVLDINEADGVVHVEPNCTMGQITEELIPKGWTLAVTPELDSLTVGGLIMGFGIESSSHKYGLFQYACTAFEIVLPNGEYVRCTHENNPELFASIPWSHGTLGFLVGAEIKIVPAKEFVHLTYLSCSSLASVVNVFTRASQCPDFEFVEALMFSKDTGVVMVGHLADKDDISRLTYENLIANSPVNRIGRYYKPWFYQHVKTFLRSQNGAELSSNLKKLDYLSRLYKCDENDESSEELAQLALQVFKSGGLRQELIPLRDYYHRHTKGLFWEMEDIVPFGNDFWFRYIFGWAFPPHVSLLKLTTTEEIRTMYETAHVVQDMLVPVGTLQNSILEFHKELEIYPLWICPARLLTPPMDGFWETQSPLNGDPDLIPLPEGSQLPENPNISQWADVSNNLCGPSPTGNLYVDIGAYGVPRATQWFEMVSKLYGIDKVKDKIPEVELNAESDKERNSGPEPIHVQVMRRVEEFVRANHGFQALYADCFQTRQEFRRMFNHQLYDRMRIQYECEGKLPSIYDKISREARR